MARSTSSRAAWPASTLTSKSPAAPRFPEGQQDRGLARLPGRVQHEVPHVSHQVEHYAEIEPFKWRYAVVALGDDGAFGVELAHVSPEVCRMC